MRTLENANIWDMVGCGAIGIPTNGYVSRNGNGVMGAGLALEARVRYPGIAYSLGTHIRTNGNVVGLLQKHPDTVISIPTKPSSITLKSLADSEKVMPSKLYIYPAGSTVPGYHCKSDINLIERSLRDLLDLISKTGLKQVFIPLLGCGKGGLSPTKDLFPLLCRLQLPNSITLVIPDPNDK